MYFLQHSRMRGHGLVPWTELTLVSPTSFLLAVLTGASEMALGLVSYWVSHLNTSGAALPGGVAWALSLHSCSEGGEPELLDS